MLTLVFRAVKQLGLAGGYKSFLHLQGIRQCVLSKRWRLPTSPHGITTEKINIDFMLFRCTAIKSGKENSGTN
jgi:hypothetical protein